MVEEGPYPAGVLQRLQDVERDILAVVDVLCREHGITYFLDSGTCLGAVRNGGFIPWDDDIDIGMPWDDYKRFCEIAPHALPEGYSLHTIDNSENFSALWAKVYKDGTRFLDASAVEAGSDQGIFIDVFPYCRLAADPRIAKKQMKQAAFWQRMSYLKAFAHPKIPQKAQFRSLLSGLCVVAHHTIAHFWSYETMRDKQEQLFEGHETGDDWCCLSYTLFGAQKGEDLFPTADIEFDGMKLLGPHNPDGYLRAWYGDYMKLPPAKDRFTHAPVILDFGDGVNIMEQRQTD